MRQLFFPTKSLKKSLRNISYIPANKNRS